MISENVPPPRICANVGVPTIDVPGVVTCSECEITSVTPSSTNSIPSVATNDAILT